MCYTLLIACTNLSFVEQLYIWHFHPIFAHLFQGKFLKNAAIESDCQARQVNPSFEHYIAQMHLLRTDYDRRILKTFEWGINYTRKDIVFGQSTDTLCIVQNTSCNLPPQR